MDDDDVAEFVSRMPSARHAPAIDVPSLIKTRRAVFELKDDSENLDLNSFIEDDDEEDDKKKNIKGDKDKKEGQDEIVEDKGDKDKEGQSQVEIVEGKDGNDEGGTKKNNYEYLKDMSSDVFSNPPEGTLIQDVLGDGSVLKVIIREGQGITIPDNAKVFVHYTCAPEGPESEVFDTSLNGERPKPIEIDMKAGGVLPGFYVALKSMTQSEVAKFLVHYDKAFKEFGCPPRVPPRSNLIFAVEMMYFYDEEQRKKIEYMSPVERAELPFSAIYEFCTKKKKEGNDLYASQDFAGAKKAYFQAASVLEGYPTNETDIDKQQEMLFMLFNNLAQTCIKMEKWSLVSLACRKGLDLPNSCAHDIAKMNYRLAIAKRMLGDLAQALDVINRAFELDGKNRNIKEERAQIMDKIKEEKELSTELMARLGKGLLISARD